MPGVNIKAYVRMNLLEKAKLAGVNFSAFIDNALSRELARRWWAENAETRKFCNDRIEKDGLWLDAYRT
jgi:post-segregation antitoxin (ccd killing protein)